MKTTLILLTLLLTSSAQAENLIDQYYRQGFPQYPLSQEVIESNIPRDTSYGYVNRDAFNTKRANTYNNTYPQPIYINPNSKTFSYDSYRPNVFNVPNSYVLKPKERN